MTRREWFKAMLGAVAAIILPRAVPKFEVVDVPRWFNLDIKSATFSEIMAGQWGWPAPAQVREIEQRIEQRYLAAAYSPAEAKAYTRAILRRLVAERRSR